MCGNLAGRFEKFKLKKVYFSWGRSKIAFYYVPFIKKNKNQLTNSKKRNKIILLFDGTNLNSREYHPGNPKRA